MGKRPETIRRGFTAKRRLWAGICLFALVVSSALVGFEANLSVLLAPAATFFVSIVLPASS